MSNVMTVINDQIRRLSRREITGQSKTIRKLTAQHRRDIASLKRQVASLQKAVSFLERQEKRRVGEQPAPVKELDGIRFRADGLRSHRARLGISAEDYGRLVGVSGQSIYMWEQEKSRPRKSQVSKLAPIRGLGKREVLKRLEMLNGRSEK